jgi:hypothetical protein
MTLALLLVLGQWTGGSSELNLNQQPVLCMDEGAYCSATKRRTFEVNCSGAGITCTQTAGRMIITVPGGGGGGSGAPLDGGYLTLTAGSTGSSNEVVLSAGTNIAISGGGVVSVTGTVASATTASTATALASNPTDCSAGQYANAIAASGNLTCSSLAAGDVTTGTLAGARGGLGATQPTCAAGDFITCNGTSCSCSTPSGGGGGLTAAQVQRLVAIGGP